MRAFRSFLTMTLLLSLWTLFTPPAPADTGASTRVTDPKQHVSTGSGGYAYRQKCDLVLKELDLREGDAVVDIGAGDGWWSEHIADRVGPTGTVYAAEVEPKLVDKMKQRFATKPQVKPYLCKPDSLELPDNSCDLAFISQVYHHLPKDGRVEYLQRLRKVIRPTGRLCVIERYSEIAGQGKDHGTQLSRLLEEAEKAGWIPVRCELLTGTECYQAMFVQKDLFPPPKPKPKARPEGKKAK